jgi:hypothetical protein
VTLLFTKCAREVAKPLRSTSRNLPRRGKTHGASTGLALALGLITEQIDDPVVKNELLELASVCNEVANNIEDHLTGG